MVQGTDDGSRNNKDGSMKDKEYFEKESFGCIGFLWLIAGVVFWSIVCCGC